MSVHIISWARYHPTLANGTNVVNQTRVIFGMIDAVQACEFYADEFAKTEECRAGWVLLGNPNVLHVDQAVYDTWAEHVAPVVEQVDPSKTRLQLVKDDST